MLGPVWIRGREAASSRMRPTAIIAVVLAVGIVGAGAYAAIPDTPGGTIHVCYDPEDAVRDKSGAKLRIIDKARNPDDCDDDEVELTFNAAGPQGDRPGRACRTCGASTSTSPRSSARRCPPGTPTMRGPSTAERAARSSPVARTSRRRSTRPARTRRRSTSPARSTRGAGACGSATSASRRSMTTRRSCAPTRRGRRSRNRPGRGAPERAEAADPEPDRSALGARLRPCPRAVRRHRSARTRGSARLGSASYSCRKVRP